MANERTHVTITPETIASDTCPFCGRGPVVAPAKRPRRSSKLAVYLRDRDDMLRRWEIHQDEIEYWSARWAYGGSDLREHTAEERAQLAEARTNLAKHMGEIPIVDGATNRITGWRPEVVA